MPRRSTRLGGSEVTDDEWEYTPLTCVEPTEGNETSLPLEADMGGFSTPRS